MSQKYQYKYEKLANNDEGAPQSIYDDEAKKNRVVHALTAVLAFLLLAIFIYALFAFASIEKSSLGKDERGTLKYRGPISGIATTGDYNETSNKGKKGLDFTNTPDSIQTKEKNDLLVQKDESDTSNQREQNDGFLKTKRAGGRNPEMEEKDLPVLTRAKEQNTENHGNKNRKPALGKADEELKAKLKDFENKKGEGHHEHHHTRYAESEAYKRFKQKEENILKPLKFENREKEEDKGISHDSIEIVTVPNLSEYKDLSDEPENNHQFGRENRAQDSRPKSSLIIPERKPATKSSQIDKKISNRPQNSLTDDEIFTEELSLLKEELSSLFEHLDESGILPSKNGRKPRVYSNSHDLDPNNILDTLLGDMKQDEIMKENQEDKIQKDLKEKRVADGKRLIEDATIRRQQLKPEPSVVQDSVIDDHLPIKPQTNSLLPTQQNKQTQAETSIETHVNTRADHSQGEIAIKHTVSEVSNNDVSELGFDIIVDDRIPDVIISGSEHEDPTENKQPHQDLEPEDQGSQAVDEHKDTPTVTENKPLLPPLEPRPQVDEISDFTDNPIAYDHPGDTIVDIYEGAKYLNPDGFHGVDSVPEAIYHPHVPDTALNGPEGTLPVMALPKDGEEGKPKDLNFMVEHPEVDPNLEYSTMDDTIENSFKVADSSVEAAVVLDKEAINEFMKEVKEIDQEVAEIREEEIVPDQVIVDEIIPDQIIADEIVAVEEVNLEPIIPTLIEEVHENDQANGQENAQVPEVEAH